MSWVSQYQNMSHYIPGLYAMNIKAASSDDWLTGGIQDEYEESD